jgi:hypothetical protein
MTAQAIPVRVADGLAATLAAAPIVAFAALGLTSVAIAWSLVAAAIAVGDHALRTRTPRGLRVALALLLLPLLVLFGWLGGLLFIPAALAPAVRHSLDRPRRPSVEVTRRPEHGARPIQEPTQPERAGPGSLQNPPP